MHCPKRTIKLCKEAVDHWASGIEDFDCMWGAGNERRSLVPGFSLCMDEKCCFKRVASRARSPNAAVKPVMLSMSLLLAPSPPCSLPGLMTCAPAILNESTVRGLAMSKPSGLGDGNFWKLVAGSASNGVRNSNLLSLPQLAQLLPSWPSWQWQQGVARRKGSLLRLYTTDHDGLSQPRRWPKTSTMLNNNHMEYQTMPKYTSNLSRLSSSSTSLKMQVSTTGINWKAKTNMMYLSMTVQYGLRGIQSLTRYLYMIAIKRNVTRMDKRSPRSLSKPTQKLQPDAMLRANRGKPTLEM
mmetsp:Transcript_9997/g.24913  ORF Transcript_9997/g.24913 Transcript_9997/m.24913 type:complete len:297 (+) Transcript_9997:288-1178(+)